MNSRQLWNLHQRYKFSRAEESRDILKLRVSEIAFPRGFQDVFSTADAFVLSSEYTQDWEQCHRNVPGVP